MLRYTATFDPAVAGDWWAAQRRQVGVVPGPKGGRKERRVWCGTFADWG